MIKVVIDEGAYMPIRAHNDDAGWDILAPHSFVVEPHSSTTIDVGIHVEIPKGFVGMLKTKSSLNMMGLHTEGVIDCGYTGSIKVKVTNLSEFRIPFERGRKITQLVIIPINSDILCQVDKLEDTERADGGFGSTGA